ncbi:hypothetical protein V8C37DRAFT_377470 [Trichoderma ceciliae]
MYIFVYLPFPLPCLMPRVTAGLAYRRADTCIFLPCQGAIEEHALCVSLTLPDDFLLLTTSHSISSSSLFLLPRLGDAAAQRLYYCLSWSFTTVAFLL